jgi:hypothetical protein
MQRLLTLVFVLCLAVPAGISISGCTRNPQGNYCNGEGYGLKDTAVDTIILQPQTTGISLAYGQTQQLASPTAKTCKGTSASVASYTYGTTNNQIVDVSPSGNLCAGTWNRNSGGGIPNFTICQIPNPLPTTNGLPYVTAAVTATGAGVTSNQVTVFTHAQVTAVSLELEQLGTTNTFTGCLSQTQTAQLNSEAFYTVNGQQTLLCSPTPPANQPNIPSCSTAIGNLTYSSQNTSIATIDEYGVITAVLPGTTYITASVAGSGSSAGYFSTCPPAKINVSLNGATSGTVTQGVTQNLVTTITDTQGNTIQGLTLNYQSTNPLDISVGSGGAITANYAGEATVYAVCQPTTCNPSPIDKVGVNQTGVSITSNPVTITTPGIASDYIWMSSPTTQSCSSTTQSTTGSQYFVPVELISGTVGSTVKMPYVPNSMVLDQTGTSLYFGSCHELMIYAATTNTLTKEDPNVPGVVLAAAPNNQTILINDQVRQVFYVYAPSAGTYSTFSGIGTKAQWSPDSQTLFVVGTSSGVPTFFVYNLNTGWTTYPLETGEPTDQTVPATTLAVTVPAVGAFLSGNPTVAHGWCPELTASNTIAEAYPQMGYVDVPTQVLGATPDGGHILGADLTSPTSATLYDIGVSFAQSLNNGACPAVANGGGFTSTNITTSPVTTPTPPQAAIPIPSNVQVSTLDQVVPSQASNVAFVTYSAATGSTGTATLPYYEPNTSDTLGTVGQVNFVEPAGTTTPATAPVVGVFSLDDTIFFVSTTGDDLVHFINVSTLTDTQQLAPGLVDVNGNPVAATAIAVKPRPTT